MKVVSVNTARPRDLFVQQSGHAHRFVSSIRKQPRQGAVHVGPLGLDGDEQADLGVHGGPAKSDAWVSDRLRIGTVLLEVAEPRQPCFKFNARMGFSHASKTMIQAGNSGFYLRVIETGELAAGDVVILHPGRREISIAQINERRRKGRQRDLF